MFYVKLYVHSLVDKLKRFYENARCYNKIYILMIPIQSEAGKGGEMIQLVLREWVLDVDIFFRELISSLLLE